LVGYYRGWIFYSEEKIVKQHNISKHGMFEGPFLKGMRGARSGKCYSKEAAINIINVAQD
jgi:hypothetical protein